jgi:hypothetical protein
MGVKIVTTGDLRYLRVFVLLSGLCLIAGCQTGAPDCSQAIAQLQGEIIERDNRYYELESEYLSAMSELERYRNRPNLSRPSEPGLRETPDRTVPQIQQPDFSFDDIGSGIQQPDFQTSRSSDLTPQNNNWQPGHEAGGSHVNRQTAYLSASSQVVAIEVEPTSIRSYDTNGEQGDDEIEMLIQPLDSDGGVLPVPGEIHLRLFDPQLSENVGHWNFRKDETSKWVQDGANIPPGLLLKVSFAQAAPSSERLILYITYHSEAGTAVETAVTINVELPNQANSDRWTENRKNFAADPQIEAKTTKLPNWSPDR